MDQLRTRVGSTFGIEELGGQGIDDPGTAQPSIAGMDNREAGSADGSLDVRGEHPPDGHPDAPANDVADSENAGTETG